MTSGWWFGLMKLRDAAAGGVILRLNSSAARRIAEAEWDRWGIVDGVPRPPATVRDAWPSGVGATVDLVAMRTIEGWR